MRDPLERYTAETLLAPAAGLSVMRQQVRRVDVHWHDFYELVHVTDGRAVHRVNGVEESLRPGSTFLLTPADFHEISTESDEPLAYYNVVVEASLIEDRLDPRMLVGLDRTAWVLPEGGELASDFHRLWDESALARPGALGMMEAVLQCILIELARRCAPGASMGSPDRLPREQADIKKAVLFLDRHFREPLTLAGVAAQVHLSANYFSERFREFTGSSFQGYLQQRRLAFAHSLLAATALGVTEVCHAAGFNNLSHFGRAYRSRYGTSPSAFRGASGGTPGTSKSRSAS
jgi:AraC-like DNA-binding protein/mannose-6-phosphate isomerase-like protein (cupin superfamily)